jgi:hypothetical protein
MVVPPRVLVIINLFIMIPPGSASLVSLSVDFAFLLLFVVIMATA